MALVIADRVKETSNTTGTGTYTLAGAVTGFETFASIGDGNTTYYACVDDAGNFEVGIGTYASSGTTLARTSILQSSNSDSAVNWSAGTKTLFCTMPAEKSIFKDASGNISLAGDLTVDTSTLKVDSANNRVGIGTDSPTTDLHIVGDTTDDQVIIENTNAGAANAPDLTLFRNSSSPADNDVLGILRFDGKNDAAETVEYAIIQAKADDVSDGTEDGILIFKNIIAGTLSESMRIDGANVGIGTNSPSAQFHISGDDVTNQVIIENTSADANNAPDLLLKRNSSSPADDDEVGMIVFQGRNDNSQFPTLATMRVIFKDVTDTTEDAALVYKVMTNGTLTEVMRLEGGNLGIGTTTTSGILTIGGDDAFEAITLRDNTQPANMFSITCAEFSGSGGNANKIEAINTSDISFELGGAERVRLEATGELCVGTTGTSGMVFIQSTGSSKPAIFSNASNASYTGVEHRIRATRSGASAYFFIFAESNSGSDTEFFVRGNGNVKADGSFTGGGADYAEMFEWEDGNSDNEDRRGYSVVLTSGNKVRKATSDDKQTDIIGIVSGNAMIVGDTQSMKWQNKYQKDDFGNYIFESYTVTSWTEGETEHSYETDKIPSNLTAPKDAVVSDKDDDGVELKRRKLNSDYDDSKTYIPREERPEWDAIGMVGKLRMRSGQPTGDRWIKMRDVASGVEEWLVR